MMISRGLDLEGLLGAHVIRCIFAATLLATLSVHVCILMRVRALSEEGRVKVPAKRQLGQLIEDAKEVSCRQYDLSILKEKCTQIIMSALVCWGVTLYWGGCTLLILHTAMLPCGLLDLELFKIHILGRVAQGKLRRPFPSTDPLGKLFSGKPEGKEPREKKKDKKHR